jgi:predicted dehydrogenase
LSNEPILTGVTDRRTLLAAGASAVAASALQLGPVHAGSNDVIKVGLVGCGGRGTGAARNALEADPGVKIVALADVFPEKLDFSLAQLKALGGDRVTVTKETSFSGIDGYKKLIPLCDVVLLCTPPHFRPVQLAACVEAGKHVFCEKPVAVDAPGVRSVIKSSELAKSKGLSLVNGLCWRYDDAKREMMHRIHGGAIGDIVTINVIYNARELWSVDRKPGMSDMEWQIRNWLYFTWLSGDHNVEQHIHSLDKGAWAMKDEAPVRAWGLGGRQSRTEPRYGHIFDHHAVCYEYASGARMFAFCRQQSNTHTDTSDHFWGTKGKATLLGNAHSPDHTITGANPFKYKRPRKVVDMYTAEHIALYKSIRENRPRNDGDYMTKSTMLAIMGRMATYTGQLITWEQAMNSKEDLTPPSYEFSTAPMPEVARPGVTTFA